MPANYSGNPANVAGSLTRFVQNATSGAGGEILIETPAPHLYADNDSVIITNVIGTSEANGTWVITIVDANHFLLNGSTFVHAYSNGGDINDVSLTPYFQVPKNGEPVPVESILASIKAVADRTQFLWGWLRQLVGIIGITGKTLVAIAQNAAQGTSHGWGGVDQGTGYFELVGTNPGPQVQVSTIVAAVGDIIEVTAAMSFVLGTTANGNAFARLEYVENYNGGSGQTTTAIPGTEVDCGIQSGTPLSIPMTLSGFYVATVAGPVAICINGVVQNTGGTATDWHLLSGNTVVKQWRPIP